MDNKSDIIDVTYTECLDKDVGQVEEDIQDISNTDESAGDRKDFKGKVLKIVGVILGITVIFVLNLYKVSITLDTDTMWHIKTGEWVVKNRAFPTEDVFSWVDGLEWKAHEVGFDVILYLVYSQFGLVGVNLLGNILNLMAISIVTLYNYKRKRYNWGYLIFAICMYMCFSISSVSRPAEVTIILLLINIWVYTDRGKPLSFWLSYPITTFLCGWLHGGYIVSLLLQMIVLLIADIILLLHSKIDSTEEEQRHCKNIVRNKIIVMLIGTLTSLLNPLGYKIYTYSLNQPDVLYENISEWHA